MKNFTPSRCFRCCLLLAAILVGNQALFAQTWTGSVSTDWHTAGNWSPATVPTATSAVTITDVTRDPVIGAAAAAKSVTVNSGGVLTISAAGSLDIDGSTSHGILNNGTVSNSGTINIGATVTVQGIGIYNKSVFNNNAGGLIYINRTNNLNGFWNSETNSTFTNDGTLTIGNIAAVGGHGLESSGIVNNNATGTITIDNTTSTGMYNKRTGKLYNYGTVSIGNTAGFGWHGIDHYGYPDPAGVSLINNYPGGQITINRWPSYGHGLHCNGSIVNNEGTITIGNIASPTGSNTYGIHDEDNVLFNNKACGSILMFAKFYNSLRVFNNIGYFMVSTTGTHSNDGGLTNTGIIEYPQGNPIPSVVNQEIIAAPVSGGCSISPALSLGTTVDFTIGTTWYLNDNLTSAAGTYNTATNTLTATNLPNNTPTTVYFAVTDGANACTKTVSIKVTINATYQTYYQDRDNDGYGNAAVSQTACTAPGGYVSNSTDCNDTNINIYPGATEICNNADDDCDGMTDEGISLTTFYADADNDTYGNAAVTTQACTAPGGYVANSTDCNDMDININPDATEVCNNADDDCDNLTDTADPSLVDLTPPSVGCPSDQTVATDGTCAGTVGSHNALTMSDNCSTPTVSQSPASGTILNGIGDFETVVLTATDAAGNTASCSFTVTLVDAPPTAICRSAGVALDVVGTASLSAAAVNNGSSDGCTAAGDLVFSLSPNMFDCDDVGTTVATLTVTDGSGNSANCTASVTVVDLMSFTQTATPVASDGLSNDHFGWGLGMDGSVLVAGAPDDKVGTQNKQGSAYVFLQNEGGTDNWGQSKQIKASDGAAVDYFGNAVSVDGDFVLVGAHGDNVGAITDAGSAYIYEKDLGSNDNWGQRTNIAAQNGAASDAVAYDYFGNAVSLKNGRAVIGANKKKIGANTAQGAAYIYEQNAGGANAWGNVKKLTASDGAANNFFGQSVAQSGDVVLVGANGHNSNRGAAYLFNGANNWAELQKLTAADPAVGDGFGTSVSLSGNYALIGAMNKATYTGAAYVFKHDGGTWAQVKKLVASDGVANDRFGASVVLSDNYAYVTALRASGNVGAVYVFHKDAGGSDNWGQIGKYTAASGATGDQFGYSLAASGEWLALGGNLDDVGAKADQGSAVVFKGEGNCLAPTRPESIVFSQPQGLAISPSVQCWPNPFRDELTVEIAQSGTSNLASEIQVMDAAGRLMARAELPAGQTRFELKTNEFRAGMYFVQISSEAGVNVVPVALVR